MRTLPIVPPRVVALSSLLLAVVAALLVLFGHALLGGAAAAIALRGGAMVLTGDVASAAESDEGDLGFAALPELRGADVTELRGAVRDVVAGSFDGKGDHVRGEVRACGEAAASCAEVFARAVTEMHRGLAPSLRAAADRVAGEASDLEVTVWCDPLDGPSGEVVVTLHGRVGDSLVGLVVSPPPASATPAAASPLSSVRAPHRRHRADRSHVHHHRRHASAPR